MHHLTATDYTWFIMIGFIVGYVADLLFHNNKVSTSANLIMGIIFGVIGGIIPQIIGASGNLIMATWVPFITLLVVNVNYIGSNAKLHTHEAKDEKQQSL